jgi:hypothetical protein
MERTTIWLSDEDKAAFVEVQALYGCESFSHAVRLAGRLALQTGRLNMPLPPTSRFSKTKRPPAAGNFFADLLELSDVIEIEGLPEDFTERLDDYLYGDLLGRGAQAGGEAPPSG